MIGSEPIHVPRADAVDCPRHLRAPIYIARTVLGGPRRDGDDLAFRGGEAEERGDVVAHLGEGVAAQLPRLVEVVEPLEADPLVADSPKKHGWDDQSDGQPRQQPVRRDWTDCS